MANVTVRLMDKDEDYKKMGTKKGTIEVWEDGKRDDDRAGVYEWWYFDMILDGEQVIKRSGDMIYEFVYMGTTVKEKMEN